MKQNRRILALALVSSCVSLYAVSALQAAHAEHDTKTRRLQTLLRVLHEVHLAASSRTALPGSDGRTAQDRMGHPDSRKAMPPALPKLSREQFKVVASRVAEQVGSEFDRRLWRMDLAREGQLNLRGEWKAPFQELASRLNLSEDQREATNATINKLKDDIFDLLRTEREDGSSPLDDVADMLASGQTIGQVEATLQAHQDELVPGTNRTYIDEVTFLIEVHLDELGEHLDKDQLHNLKELQVALGEVQNGYEPWVPYIKAAYAKAKLRQSLLGED